MSIYDPNDLSEVLTLSEVAQILLVSKQSLYRMRKRKYNPLPVIQLGSKTPRILKKALIAWIDSQEDPRQDI